MSQHEQTTNGTCKSALEKFRRRAVPIDFEIIIPTGRREKQHANPPALTESGHRQARCAAVLIKPHKHDALGCIALVLHRDRLNAWKLAFAGFGFHLFKCARFQAWSGPTPVVRGPLRSSLQLYASLPSFSRQFLQSAGQDPQCPFFSASVTALRYFCGSLLKSLRQPLQQNRTSRPLCL